MIDDWIADLTAKFDPQLTKLDGSVPVPDHWQPYLSDSATERQFQVRQELQKIEPYFPQLAEGLRNVVLDAFLVRSSIYGLCRVMVRQISGEVYYAYSRAPTAFVDQPRLPGWPIYADRAPDALKWIHVNVMDGLTDIYGFGGLHSSGQMKQMDRPNSDYAELPWFAEFAEDIDATQIIEIFNSGGGAFMLIDLTKDLSEAFEPSAMIVDFKSSASESFREVELFPYLDAWMSIGLAGGE